MNSESTLCIPQLPEFDIAPESKPLLVSHPKSGRTWIRYIFALVQKPLDTNHFGFGSAIQELGKEFSGLKTSAAENRLCLFMHRNPIDTAISWYFQVTRKDFRILSKRYMQNAALLWFENRLPPRDLISFLHHSGYGVERVCKFNRYWIDHLSSRESAMTFSYEEMKFSTEKTLQKMFEFSQIENFDMKYILKQSSFENMSALERSGKASHLRLNRIRDKDPDSAKVRRGKVRGYRDYLDQESIECFQDLCQVYGFEA